MVDGIQRFIPRDSHFLAVDIYVTTITLRVEITAGAFIISANGLHIAKYPYRGALHPPIHQIEYAFEDTGASKPAKLESLTVKY